MSCVSIDVLTEQVRRLTHARLAALIALVAAKPQHNPGNLADGWYVDEIYRPDGSHYHGGRRHKLETSASMSMSGTTIRLVLNYNIIDITPPQA